MEAGAHVDVAVRAVVSRLEEGERQVVAQRLDAHDEALVALDQVGVDRPSTAFPRGR